MKYLFILLFAFAMSGCAMFAGEIDKVSGKIGEGVDKYCLELDQDGRAKVRDEVNPTPGGATIVVTCPGDS